MRHFLFLLIVLLSGSALDALPTPVQVLGPVKLIPPQCADPTYACQDLENARQCGTVKSCSNDVWATMSAPEDNDDVCTICKEMVKEARDQLLSNMTQEELKEVFEGSCKLLPIKLVADGCIKLVDEFIPQLVEMLVSRMDPNMVCTVCGLCNPARLPIEEYMRNLLNLAVVHVDPNKCQQCTTIMAEVKTFVGEMSEADFEKECTSICNDLDIPLCSVLIESYAPKAYQYIKSCDPKTACTDANICPSVEKIIHVPLQKVKVQDDLVCQFCTNVLEHVREMMIANTTVEEFKTALLNFCSHCGSFSEKCKSIVDDYYDMIFDYLRKLDTKQVCTVIGLCQNGMFSNRISPLVKVFPAETLPKRTKMTRLTPSLPVTSNFYFQPMVKLVPAIEMSKKNLRKDADIETNDIFGSADKVQLPAERLALPLMTVDRELNCPFCRAVTFFLEKDLGNDRTKDGVKNAVNSVCGKWVQEYPDQCRLFLEKYSDQVINHITENGDFDTLCTHIKACQLQEKITGVDVRVISPSPSSASDICDLCKKVCDEAETFVKNPKLQNCIRGYLEQVCQIWPSKDKCISAIDQNINKLFAIIEQYVKGEVACPALHLCPGGSNVHLSASVKSLECTLCKDFVQQLESKLEDPQTKAGIRLEVEKLCNGLPGNWSAKCKSIIDEDFDTFFQVLVSSLKPDQVCSVMKMCPGLEKIRKPPIINDLECDLCKDVIQKVEDQLKDKKTVDNIKQTLEHLCEDLPESMQDKCKSIVNNYTDTVITYIIEKISPATLCFELGKCPKPKMVKLPKNDMECDMCKEVVEYVEDELKDKKTEDAIRDALDKVCSWLPSSLSNRCQTFVNTYTELLVTLILQEMDPTMVCASMKICPEQDIECETCQYAFHYIQEQLADNDTQDELKNVLKRFCDLLPDTYAKNCDAFTDEYGSSLFLLLAQELDPSVVCPKLGMCPSTKKHLQKIAEKTSVESLTFDKCEVCETVVDTMDKLLENDDVDTEITAVIVKVCNVLPTSVEDKCSAVVETYGPYLLQMIGQIADSKQLCQDIDLCPRTPGHVHLLGGKKCTFGPSYWCQTKAHAAACKAEMFCKQKIWKN